MLGLDTRMRLARLCLCVDTRSGSGELVDMVAAAVDGGVDLVQLREPGLSVAAEAAAVDRVRQATRPAQVPVAESDRVEVARVVNADVLELGSTAGSARAARSGLKRWAQIGRTVHAAAQVDAALADPDVDYLCVGPVADDAGAGPGLDLVRYLARRAPVDDLQAKPWWAFGRIGPDSLDQVLAAGAVRVVVGRAITVAADPRAAAQALRRRLDERWRDPDLEPYVLGAVGNRSTLRRR